MNFKFKLSFALYAANVVFLVATGFVFEFANEFLPFHSDVIQTKWQDVDSLSQILYLGMMRTEAAGFLASGTAIGILLLLPFRKFEQWSCWAMSAIGIIEYLPTFFANYHVSSVTSASPPWPLMLILIFSLLLALFLAIIAFNENTGGRN